MLKNEKIKYLGSKKMQISEDEIKECRFYTLDIEEVTLGCSDYFIVNDSKRYKEDILLESRGELNIVTFDEELIINSETIKARKKIADEEIIEEFLYSLVLYHIENNDNKSAEVILANTEDISAYIDFINSKEVFDKDSELKNLKSLISNKNSRFKGGKTKIKVANKESEQSCLLEILKSIKEDKESTLLWKTTKEYKRVGTKKKLVDRTLVFNRFKEIYGEVSDINIGSKKLNIGIKVKVLGQVENLRNKLKLDACIYREYNLISNGKVNNNLIYCTLSKALKSKLSKEKLLKIVSNSKHDNKQVYSIDITDIPISNIKMTKILNQKEIAQYLYDIEVLACKSLIISKKIKEIEASGKLKTIECDISKEELDIRKMFRVNSSGIYTPENIIEEKEFQVYIADILQWGIVKFPKKAIENSIKNNISKILEEDINIAYKKLIEELKDVKNIKKMKENLINIIKISAYMFDVNIFEWDTEEFKSKTSFDKSINTNTVIAGRVKINTKKIDNITIKQEFYRAIVKTTLK